MSPMTTRFEPDGGATAGPCPACGGALRPGLLAGGGIGLAFYPEGVGDRSGGGADATARDADRGPALDSESARPLDARGHGRRIGLGESLRLVGRLITGRAVRLGFGVSAERCDACRRISFWEGRAPGQGA